MISIITALKNVCWNDLNYHFEIFSNLYDNGYRIEWIIQNSTNDDSFNVLNSNYYKFLKYEYYEDKSIYEAWNRGLQKVSGNMVTYLGVDDIPSKEWLKFVLDHSNVKSGLIVCHVLMIDNELKPLGIRNKISPGSYNSGFLSLANPGIFYSIDLFYNRNFDEKYRIISDTIFLLQLGNIEVLSVHEEVGVKMVVGGISNSIYGSRARFIEFLDSLFVYNLSIKFKIFIRLIKNLPAFILSYCSKVFFIFQEFRWKYF